MEKSILLIDDSTDHIGVLDVIVAHLKKEQLIVISRYVNPIERSVWDENGDPQLSLVIKKIVEVMSTIKPDLIVVDQYYSDVTFNGLQVIEELRKINKFKNCKIFLISGNRDKIIREIFENEKSDIKEKVELFSKIINFNITRFLDKSFQNESIEVLKKRDILEIIPRKLREYEDGKVVLHRFSPNYSTLTTNELAAKIEEGSIDGERIFEEIMDLSISYYHKIINDDK